MSAAFGSFLTALGEGVGDYGQIEHKGTIDALNDQAEMAKAQRLMSLEETQLATSNMFKMANLDMEGERLELSKQAGARAEAELQMKRDEAALGDYKYEKRDIRQVVMKPDPLNPDVMKPTSVIVGTEWIRFNNKDPSDVQVLKPGQTTWSAYKPEDTGGGTTQFTEEEIKYIGAFEAQNGRILNATQRAELIRLAKEQGLLKGADGSSTTTINPAGQDAGVPTLPPREGGLQPYEWSEERLDKELKHWNQTKGLRENTKKVLRAVGDTIEDVVTALETDNPEDNKWLANILGTGANAAIYLANQFKGGDEVVTEVDAVQWLMENRGYTVSDIIKISKKLFSEGSLPFSVSDEQKAEIRERFGEREVIEPGDSGAVIPTENIDPRKNTILSAEAQAAITSIDGTQPPPEKPFEISPEAKRMMEINEIPEAQGSKALATIAQAIGDPVEVITEAINSLPKDSAVIKIIRHWENQDLDEITSAIEMVKKQIAKIIPSTGDGLITGDVPVPVEQADFLPGRPPMEAEQDSGGIILTGDAGEMALQKGSRLMDFSRGRQGEGGLSMDADYRTLPGTFSRAHGQDDPQEAGTMNRAEIKALLDPTQRHRQEVETDIFKMSYDESIQIIREVVDNLVKSGMSNKEVIDQLLRVVEGTSKSNEKKFNESAYKKALQDTIIGLHTLNK